MTLSQISFSNISVRVGALAAAALTSSVLMFAAPQAHAAKGPYYQVELTQPAAQSKQLIRGVFVRCEGTSCSASIASSAAKNMCVSIAREFGEVASFKAGKRDFDAAELSDCNEDNREQIARK